MKTTTRRRLHVMVGFATMLLCFWGCSSSNSTATYHTYETECLGAELDGSQTVLAWGTGKDKSDAMEQAAKNAVRDVIFKGIQSGNAECTKKPLLLEVNAQEKYEDYFNAFFSDKGPYLTYVSMEDAKKRSEVKQTSDIQQKYGATVRVKRSELKTRLISDKILKQ